MKIKKNLIKRNIAGDVILVPVGSRTTVWNIEKGSPSVSIGAYAAVMHALGGMDKDLTLVCKDDVLGRTMQDLDLPIPVRSPRI